MKQKFLFLTLLALSSAFAAVKTDNVKLEVSSGKLILTDLLENTSWRTAQLTPFMYDGKTKKFAKLINAVCTDEKDAVVLTCSDKEWKWKTRFTKRDRLILGESEITNLTGKELFLEPGFTAKINFLEKPQLFWDGFGVMHPIKNKKLSRKGIRGKLMQHVSSSAIPFSAVAAMTSKSGLQLGHVMFDPVSYSAASFDPAKNELSFSQRIALLPHKILKIRWVAGSFNASYGGAEAAVQLHYDAFPECWAVDQDNPYIWGNHAHYLSWWGRPDDELTRRFKHTFEWTYTPYKRSGDMLCREELWDYKPHNPFRKKTPRFGGKWFSYHDLSREEYLKIRKEQYLKYGKKYGWMFYNSCAGTWCEINLAKEKYPDSMTQDPYSSCLLKSWSTGHDWEVRVFPMGTKFAEVFEADMKALVEELDLPGFALDCGSGGVHYRGPAVKKDLPGRAWDDDGVFIDQGVAINHSVDYMHSLRPGLTVFINGPLKGDVVMYERPFVDMPTMESFMPLYKWYIGPRPSASHDHGFMYREMVPNWRSKTQAEFIDILSKMSDHMIFCQFQMGMNNTYVSMFGNYQQIYILPEAFELKRAGWCSLIPLKLAKSIYAPYRSAYGKGENSFFFLGNSRPADCRGEVKLDNLLQTRKNDSTLMIVRKMRNQAETVNRVSGGFTAFDAELPSRVPVLFESVCAINGVKKPDFRATVKTLKKLDKQFWSVTFDETAGFTASIVPRKIREFSLNSLTLNGKKIAAGEPVVLKKGDKIEAAYRSNFFQLDKDAIWKFPFLDKNKKISCRIYLDKGDKGAESAAAKINGFFNILRKYNVLPKNGGAVPKSNNKASLLRKDVIILNSQAAFPRIAVTENGGIIIEGRNADELEKMVNKFLDVLDYRYPLYLPFRGVMGLKNEMIRAAKMTGKYLPHRAYFD